MAPGRSRSNSHIQARSISPNVQKQGPKQRSHRGPTQATNSPTPAPARAAKPLKNEHLSTVLTPEPTVELGMTPADRYYTNLRVLRRRDSMPRVEVTWIAYQAHYATYSSAI